MLPDRKRPTLGDIVGLFWRRRLVISVITMVVVIAVLLVASQRATEYSSAQTIVLTDENPLLAMLGLPPLDPLSASIEFNTVESDRVVDLATAKLGFTPSIRVIADEPTETIKIVGFADDVQRASDSARAVAEAYQGVRRDERRVQIQRAVDQLDASIRDLRARQAEIEAKLATLTPGDPAAALLSFEHDTITNRLIATQTSSASLTTLVTSTDRGIELVSAPSEPSDGGKLSVSLLGGLGLIGGLTLGGLVVLLAALTDRRVRTRSDIEHIDPRSSVFVAGSPAGADEAVPALKALALRLMGDLLAPDVRLELVSLAGPGDAEWVRDRLSSELHALDPERAGALDITIVGDPSTDADALSLGGLRPVVVVVASARTTKRRTLADTLQTLRDSARSPRAILLIGVSDTDRLIANRPARRSLDEGDLLGP